MIKNILLKIILATLLLSTLLPAQETYRIGFEYETESLPFGLERCRIKDVPETALVLSGGGARGISQIGVIRALEENDIGFDRIIGTSMGAIVGGLYAAGYTTSQLDSIARVTEWGDFFSSDENERNELFVDQKVTNDRAILTLRLNGLTPVLPTSVNTGQRVSNFLNLTALNAPITTDSSFNELLYDFSAVSADLVTGKKIVIDGGSLATAMRASSSVSFLLAPVPLDSMMLVDGGIVENVPVKTAAETGSDFIIACNTTSPLYSRDELRYPWNIADQLISIPMKLLNEENMELADEIIVPDLGGAVSSDFTLADSLINMGYESAMTRILDIKEAYKNKFLAYADSGKVYFDNLVAGDPAGFAKMLLTKHALDDSVNSTDLKYDLYEIFKRGGLKSISAEVIPNGENNILKVYTESYPLLKGVEISGVTLPDSSLYWPGFENLQNKPFNPTETLAAILTLMRNYRSMGYSLAAPDLVRFDEKQGILYISVSEGEVSSILYEGYERTDKTIIDREFPLEEGDIYRYEEVNRGLANLRATGLFESVEVHIDKKLNRNILVLRVKERTSSLLRFGLRIDNENYTQGSFDIRDENVFGTGTEIGATISGGTRNRSFILEHKANRIFETYLTYKVQGFHKLSDINVYDFVPSSESNRFSREKTGEYRQISTGASVGLGAQVHRIGTIFMEAGIAKDEVKNKLDYEGPVYQTNVASTKWTLSIDSQDQYPYPRKGFVATSYYETAQSFLGGEVGYSKFYFDYSAFIPLNGDHNLKPRFLIGFGDQTLLLSRQFSFGGQKSFFGYRANEFRGRQIFISSLQYRYKMPFKVFFDAYFNVRYDLGSIWTNQEEIRFRDLRHGVGATFSLDTPVGPADFSVGRAFYFSTQGNNTNMVLGDVFLYFTIGYYY